MIAKSINKLPHDENLEFADDLVKKIEPKAVYMKKYDSATKLFLPIEDTPENLSFVYEIDGKLFNSLWTNSYDELKRLDKLKSDNYQTSLFEEIV